MKRFGGINEILDIVYDKQIVVCVSENRVLLDGLILKII